MFSFKYLHEKFSFPSALIGTLSADEIRIEARNIHQPDPTDVLAPMPANSRVKKLTITLPPVELPNLTELFRDVAAMCPELECFELVQDSKSDVRPNAADHLSANIERLMTEHCAPFKISFKIHTRFSAQPWPIAVDFARVLNFDLPPSEDVAI